MDLPKINSLSNDSSSDTQAIQSISEMNGKFEKNLRLGPESQQLCVCYFVLCYVSS